MRRIGGLNPWIPALLLALPLVAGLVAGTDAESPLLGRTAPAVEASTWINAQPVKWESLRDRVVLVEFWTFACGNCRNVEPYVKRWHARYSAEGLSVIAVHTPEFPHEAREENLRAYVRDQSIAYPVAVDNDFSNWKRWGNRYWPAIYLVDRRGLVRHVQIGEGGYAQTEKAIQTLLESH